MYIMLQGQSFMRCIITLCVHQYLFSMNSQDCMFMHACICKPEVFQLNHSSNTYYGSHCNSRARGYIHAGIGVLRSQCSVVPVCPHSLCLGSQEDHQRYPHGLEYEQFGIHNINY